MKKLPKSVRPEEFKQLIKATKESNRSARVAFLLAYGSGLRISEVKALTVQNIKPTYIEVVDGKGGKDRTVPLPKGWKPYMVGVLPIGKSVRSLERNFNTARDKAGLNPLYTFHSLRHGFATRLIESGVPINQVQILLGHSNLSTTSIYTRARPIDALKSYEDLF